MQMPITVWGILREGKIELQSPLPLQEGARVLVTAVSVDDEDEAWRRVSQIGLASVWNNPEDDVYAELLKD